MAKSTQDQLKSWSLMISADLRSVTSLQALQAGRMRSGLPAGQTSAPSGPDPAPASPSASPAREQEQTTQGIYGRTSFALSAPVGPLSSWVNRLQARLAMVGSTEFELTWKVKDTPAKASIFRLAPSTRRTSGSGCIGWPTPKASDGEGGRTTKTKGGGNSHLPIHAREAATWSTPSAADGKGTTGGGQNSSLRTQTHASTWPTPTANDHKGSGPTVMRQDGVDRTWQRLDYATEQGMPGAMPNGQPAQTEKRGALNPEFVSWLMGFPPEWDACAPTATPSSRRSRQKS